MDILNERILPLFDKSGKSDMELEREIGLPRSIIYDWRNGRSKSFKKYAGEIADYFDVAVNYILGNEQKNKPTTDRSELKPLARASLEIIDSLPEDLQKIALAQLRALAAAAESSKKN